MSVQEQESQDKQDVTNIATKYTLMVLFADSLFEDEQYRRAEVLCVFTTVSDEMPPPTESEPSLHITIESCQSYKTMNSDIICQSLFHMIDSSLLQSTNIALTL
jgi:hypothetical protein